jgi:hypothetical protein
VVGGSGSGGVVVGAEVAALEDGDGAGVGVPESCAEHAVSRATHTSSPALIPSR